MHVVENKVSKVADFFGGLSKPADVEGASREALQQACAEGYGSQG